MELLMYSTHQARAVLLGVLYGDCIGAAYEGQPGPITGPITVRTSRYGHPAGRGTDDTECTIAVAEGIIQSRATGQDPTWCIADLLLDWFRSGPKDVGTTTAIGIRNYKLDHDPRAGLTTPDSIANGSLMRSAPFAFLGPTGPNAAVDSSLTTHAHPVVLACVRSYVGLLQKLLEEKIPNPDTLPGLDGLRGSLQIEQNPAKIHCPGIGYAPYALNLALWAASEAPSFEQGINTIVGLGGDTDTNAAICGAVLAARFGFPDHLIPPLDPHRVDQLTQLADRLT